jgi:hypothetical protein
MDLHQTAPLLGQYLKLLLIRGYFLIKGQHNWASRACDSVTLEGARYAADSLNLLSVYMFTLYLKLKL